MSGKTEYRRPPPITTRATKKIPNPSGLASVLVEINSSSSLTSPPSTHAPFFGLGVGKVPRDPSEPRPKTAPQGRAARASAGRKRPFRAGPQAEPVPSATLSGSWYRACSWRRPTGCCRRGSSWLRAPRADGGPGPGCQCGRPRRCGAGRSPRRRPRCSLSLLPAGCQIGRRRPESKRRCPRRPPRRLPKRRRRRRRLLLTGPLFHPPPFPRPPPPPG